MRSCRSIVAAPAAVLVALLLTAAAPAAAASAAPAAPAAESAGAAPHKARPNVLVILADDLGWSDIGAFGGEIQTPHLDALADAGLKFTQFYNTARCCPSRASLLTGLYPHQAGVGHMLWDTGHPGYATRLRRDAVTLAELLGDAGYATYMTGKWHLAERVPDPKNPIGWPLDRGFQKFYGTLAGYGSFYDPATLCRDNTYITPQNDPKYRPPEGTDFYYTDAISDNAVLYLKQHAAAAAANGTSDDGGAAGRSSGDEQRADKPFFLYVAYTAAHWPLHAPEEEIARYKGKYDAGYGAIRRQRIEKLEKLGLLPPLTEPAPTTGDWEKVPNNTAEARRMEAYAAMITRMDAGIGKILDQLRATGALDNTLVLYLQDNGGCDESFFENNRRPPKDVHVMAPGELQPKTLPPMQTRDGKIVRTGPNVLAGPPESFVGYGPGWANVSNTPLRLVKKNAHEGGISTPLIVHWPAGLRGANPARGAGGAGGKVIDTPSHLIDLMPTIVELTGAAYPAQRNGEAIQPMAGRSLASLFRGAGGEGKAFDRGEPLFWEHEGNRAVRDGDWKLVAEEDKPWELYDLSRDRGEMRDLAAEHPERVKTMSDAWQAWSQRTQVQPYGAHRLRAPAAGR